MKQEFNPSRRRVLAGSLSALGLMAVAPVRRSHAAELMRTPRQSRGPFYPTSIPLDSDNDLVTIKGRSGFASGEITNVVGRVLNERGRPIAGAHIEIWQCDANGRYHHPWDRRNVPLDPNFQGYGRFTTGDDGAYRFRTIKPVPYPGRAPHIHFAISGPGTEPLVTQMYVAGAPENEHDWILNNIRDARARERLIVKMEQHADVPGELVGSFDIVLAADGRFES
ncbi:MAG: intradiol ring-cleavage dioxygenase [Acidiferrobacterales bacterium]